MTQPEQLNPRETIAIVGLAARLPGATTIDEFWENLKCGKENVTVLSRQELQEAGENPKILEDPNYVPVAVVLEDVEEFAADFFGFSPREARILDPQYRIFLECSWHALEDAGYRPDGFPGRIGVFAGCGMNTYLWENLRGGLFEGPLSQLEARLTNEKDFLATWASYKLNLTGPSASIQTACSTSLVTVHFACQSLLSYECDMALAGGVTIALPQRRGYLYREGGITSPDGHCRPFDARANGTVAGSGAGVVVLRRLSDALAARDSIYGVVLASAVNNDGSMKVGFTAPSVEGQASVIREAMSMAQIETESIRYVEAHGTGTALGDPIEFEALKKAFATDAKRFCAVGSVKANIGHLDAAAGIAGLAKVLLMFKNDLIPPSPYFDNPNPLIDLDESPFVVSAESKPWIRGRSPRRAGVSSFGMGGTNAHLVVEEPPPTIVGGPSRPNHLLCMSARSPSSLARARYNLASYLRERPQLNIADVAYTYGVGRRAMDYRWSTVCAKRDELLENLAVAQPSLEVTPEWRPVAFLFPGQGEPWKGIAAQLHDSEPVFRHAIDQCAEITRSLIDVDMRELLLARGRELYAPEDVCSTQVEQLAVVAIEYALAQLWISWGVYPEVMLGHSLGEYVAACIAGVFSLAEVLRLVAVRGHLMEQLPRGAMLAVAMSEEEAIGNLTNGVNVAAVNSPHQVVVAGAIDAISELEVEFASRGVRCHRLKTSHAFHSSMMEGICDAFARETATLRLQTPSVPIISGMTGQRMSEHEAIDPNYWVRHARLPVRFSAGLEVLMRNPDIVLLEVGPGQTLTRLSRAHPKHSRQLILASMDNSDHTFDGARQVLTACGRLWEKGIPVDWESFYGHEQRCRRSLPGYPFERGRYWVDAPSVGASISPVRSPLEEADVRQDTASQKIKEQQEWSLETEQGGSSTERIVAGVFGEAFGIDNVDSDSDFFQLGGSSLVAADVMEHLRNLFGMELPVRYLFETPTVAALAALIDEAKEGKGDEFLEHLKKLPP